MAARRGGPKVAHLFFAGDSLIFAPATIRDGNQIKCILDTYSAASGQVINYQKSAVVFSRNAPQQIQDQLLAILEVAVVQSHDKYLGLPSVMGRTKKAVFANLKDRIWKKLNGWKKRLLSRAGKEVLIKAVIQSFPTYAMSVFKLPNSTCNEINAMVRKFVK
ncbi:hypothetical protein LguiB_001799 [Lonicera macranthoides]